MTGLLQSVVNLRTALLLAMLAVPVRLADEAERAQRAWTALTGSMEQGQRVSEQISAQAAAAPFPLAATRGMATQLGQVAGGQFAARTPAEVQAISDSAAARGLSEAQRSQIADVFQRVQSLGSRRRFTFAEACRILGASSSELGEARRAKHAEPPSVLFAEDLTPTDAWRARAEAFVEACEAALRSRAAIT